MTASTDMVHANEFDDDGITDDDAGHDLLPRNWRLMAIGAAVLAILVVVGVTAFNYWSLPGPFTVEKGDALLDHTRGNLPLAITVAERVNLPVMATEAGRTTLVSYKDARRMVNDTDRVRLVVPIYPGDYVDARNRVYQPAP